MPNLWINKTIEITGRCIDWCSSQHIAHYGNELMLIPKIVTFLLIGYYFINKYRFNPIFMDIKQSYIENLLSGLLLAAMAMSAGFIYYFYKIYGG
jgi:hypothetical protein